MGEGYSDSSFEDGFRRALFHAALIDYAEEYMDQAYVQNRSLQAFVDQTVNELSGRLRGTIDQPFPEDAIPTFDKALAKFVFAFTNPSDYSDTPDYQTFLDLTREARDIPGDYAPTLHTSSVFLHRLAAHLLICRAADDNNGLLADIPYKHQLPFVKGRLEMYLWGQL